MIRILLLSICFSGGLMFGQAQDLYQPRDIKAAYKKGTRSRDGKPGQNYWQNHGRYDITITTEPPDRTIRGVEKITYINNSPDTLQNPVVKLILNIHKAGALRYQQAPADYLTSGVTIDALSVSGTNTAWSDAGSTGTWQSFHLPKPLLPHDSVDLSLQWHYDVSLKSGREGMIDSTTYFLAYFYPRIAVYDDVSGWDQMDFTEAQEFYNDFNDYKLTVKVPKNYIVWATGTLQNPGEVLQSSFADRFNKSMTSDKVINIATTNELATKRVTAQHDMNSWRWTATNITDIAATISDHFVWDGASVVVDKKTQRRVSVQAAYNDTAADFHYMVGFGQHALEWLSNNWPGVPYPFPKTTIVQGYAGMEYPMMVNDETYSDTTFSRFVAAHEIAHSWFPFYMGINEHRYGFMDEGWATMFEFMINVANLGTDIASDFFRQFRVNGWINDPAAEQDLPIITPANILNGSALGNNEYGKPALGYLAVKDLLGEEMFRKCLQGFMERWNGKHPVPWDLFYSFNDISGTDLNWFWNSWFFSNGYIDMSIKAVQKSAGGYNITIDNIGGFPAPFSIIITHEDGTKETFHQSPSIWRLNQRQSTFSIKSSKKARLVTMEGGIFVDADPSNNSFKL